MMRIDRKSRAILGKCGCGKLLEGLCYYCYAEAEATRNHHVQILPQYRLAIHQYYCGDNGGFSDEKSPGRLCPSCATKAGLVW